MRAANTASLAEAAVNLAGGTLVITTFTAAVNAAYKPFSPYYNINTLYYDGGSYSTCDAVPVSPRLRLCACV
jgi:hypothetical protein